MRSDEELVAAYLSGDARALPELVERHLSLVYSLALRLVGSSQDAEDIAQETFLKAWRSLKRYRPEASRFKTWLVRIARNSAIDHLRKRKSIPFSQFDTQEGTNVLAEVVPDDAALPDELFAQAEDVAALERAMAALPPPAREVLALHYTGGLTFLEIGELLGEPLNTVKSRHHRALLALRQLLVEGHHLPNTHRI